MRKDGDPVGEQGAGDLSDFRDGGRQCAVVVAQIHFIHCVGARDRYEGAQRKVPRNDIEDVIPKLRDAKAGAFACEPVDYGWG